LKFCSGRVTARIHRAHDRNSRWPLAARLQQRALPAIGNDPAFIVRLLGIYQPPLGWKSRISRRITGSL